MNENLNLQDHIIDIIAIAINNRTMNEEKQENKQK